MWSLHQSTARRRSVAKGSGWFQGAFDTSAKKMTEGGMPGGVGSSSNVGTGYPIRIWSDQKSRLGVSIFPPKRERFGARQNFLTTLMEGYQITMRHPDHPETHHVFKLSWVYRGPKNPASCSLETDHRHDFTIDISTKWTVFKIFLSFHEILVGL